MSRARNLVRLGLLAFPIGACGYGSDGPHHGSMHDDDDDCGGTVYAATIDTGVGLETDPGRGVGAFVEYAEGGSWRLFTSCDTLISGFVCLWDVIVSPLAAGAIFSSAPESLEADDALVWEASENLHLLA